MSETVLDRPRRYAVHCGKPLIPTMAFRKAEFYCLECGARLGMFSPSAISRDATTELHDAYDAAWSEWDEHAAGILPDGRFWRDGCDKCSVGGESHDQHLTEAEREGDRRAREWLKARASGV